VGVDDSSHIVIVIMCIQLWENFINWSS